MTQKELRELLNRRLEREKATYICKVTQINKNTMSRFKNGKIDLYPHLFQKLEAYLMNNESA